MVRYTIRLVKVAKKHLAELYKSGRKIDIKKVEIIFRELEEHPNRGIGKIDYL
jgi:toxin YoeB